MPTCSGLQRLCECVSVNVCVCVDVYSVPAMFVCLRQVSVFNMEPDGNCFRSLPCCSPGSHRLLHGCPFVSSSSSSSSSYSTSPAFLCCCANRGIHSQQLDSFCSRLCRRYQHKFPDQMYENVIAAICPWGVMCEIQWKHFIGAEDCVCVCVCVFVCVCVYTHAHLCE